MRESAFGEALTTYSGSFQHAGASLVVVMKLLTLCIPEKTKSEAQTSPKTFFQFPSLLKAFNLFYSPKCHLTSNFYFCFVYSFIKL